MALEPKNGQTIANTRDNGKITKQMVKEFFFILMEIYTKDNGSMIRQMVMELILILMEQNI